MTELCTSSASECDGGRGAIVNFKCVPADARASQEKLGGGD